MTHFIYGFTLMTLLFQLLGQFPSKGHPFSALASQVADMLPAMARVFTPASLH